MKNPYNFFDSIYCINLLERNDRYIHSKNSFEKMKIRNVIFHRVKRHPNGGRVGCFTSHMEVIKKSYDKGDKNILIFEDDIIPSNYYSIQKIKQCIKFIKNNKNWNIFYLGYRPYHASFIQCIKDIFFPTIINTYFKKNNFFAAHAYCLNRKGMKYILDKGKNILKMPIENIPQVDEFYRTNINSYGYHLSLITQNFCLGTNNDFTDILYPLGCFLQKYYNCDSITSLYKYTDIILITLLLIICIYKK